MVISVGNERFLLEVEQISMVGCRSNMMGYINVHQCMQKTEVFIGDHEKIKYLHT